MTAQSAHLAPLLAVIAGVGVEAAAEETVTMMTVTMMIMTLWDG